MALHNSCFFPRRFLSLIFIFFAGISSFMVHAQKEMDHWIFGQRVHLDFSTGVPVQVAGTSLTQIEGTAVMSDANGTLLFYTDGQTVWTAAHAVMSNGTGLMGHSSSAQSALIIPWPGSDSLYYIFTSPEQGTMNGGIHYSVVDMSLNGGAGGVINTSKNILLRQPATEKLTAVKHCNGTDFWFLTRGWNNNEFYAYHVTASGINTTPVISLSPYNLATAAAGIGNPAKIGYIKASPSGTRIAAFHYWLNMIELGEFNPWTGQLSSILTLPAIPATSQTAPPPNGYVNTYVGEFSPDERKLYTLTSWWVNSMPAASVVLYQFDVSVMNTTAIENSRYTVDSLRVLAGVGSTDGPGCIQIANNGKIYAGYMQHTALSVINNPNNSGAACGYQRNIIPLTGNTRMNGGFPNFFPYFAVPATQSDFSFTGNCEGPDVDFQSTVSPNIDSIRWDFGDPASGSANHDTAVSSQHRFTAPGLYHVRLLVYKAAASICFNNLIDTVIQDVFIPHLDIGRDTSFCADSARLPIQPLRFPGGAYLWSTGDTTPAITVRQTGTYWLHQDMHGCVARDTIDIVLDSDLEVNLGNDTSICLSVVPLILKSPQPPGTKYLWSTGMSDSQAIVTTSGIYWLKVESRDCKASDTIHVTVIPDPVVFIGPDTIICEQTPLRTGTEISDPSATYTWNTGSSTPYIYVSETGSYNLEVNLDGCVVSDTINITAMPTPETGLEDQDICPEQIISLDGSCGANSAYTWSTGDTTPVISVAAAGTYWVRIVTEHRCIGVDTVTLTYYPKPVVWLGRDTTVCEETPLVLRPGQINVDALTWSDGSTGDVLTVKYGGEYIVTAINKCGTGSDTVVVKNIFCDIWVPNAFTPNGDGVNDVFRVLGNTGRLEFLSLSVFNRWGERLFHTGDRNQGWDGIYKGSAALMGTYVYMLEYSIAGKPVLQKGNFHLLR